MRSPAVDSSNSPKDDLKKNRITEYIGLIVFMYFLGMTNIFAPATIRVLYVNFLILIVAALLAKPSFDPFKHCEAFLKCSFVFFALYIEPSNYIVLFVSTIMNGFHVGMEIDGTAYQVFYTIWSLMPWFSVIIFNDFFQVPFQKDGDQFRVVGGVTLILIFVTASSAQSKQARVNAVIKLAQANSELKEVNEKNAEMNKNLKQMLEDKDNFILLFSHETRNPLNILLGNLRLLLDEIEVPSQRTKLLRSKFCAELLLHHLNNILDTGKLANNNSLEVSSVKTKPREYLRSIWDFMEMMLNKKGLKPELILSNHLPRQVLLDPQRLTQILLNLISNAAKFTSSGSVSFRVSYLNKTRLEEKDYFPTTTIASKLIPFHQEIDLGTLGDIEEFEAESRNSYFQEMQRDLLASRMSPYLEERHGERGYLKFEIHDTGCGIKEEDLQKLFKRFTQVHSDDSQRQIGTGLGLWISKNLSQSMGGDIRVHSKLDIGTCFVVIIGIEIPLFECPFSRKSNSRKSSLIKENQNRKILLCDDDPYNLDVHKQLLKNAGWDDIVTATNGKELVDVFKSLKSGTFYGVITDIHMPILDGISAAKLIREIENQRRVTTTAKVKIGFITGHSNHNDKVICESSPLNAWFYAAKPITAAILEGHLQQQQQQQKTSLENQSIFKKEMLLMGKQKFVVLCVDDDLFNLEMLEGLLSEYNTTVLKAQSGKQALKILEEEMRQNRRVDLVLMDYHMPEMNGWETSQKVREMTQGNELSSKISIIGLSGDSSVGLEEKLKQSGMEGWIQKPVHREDLSQIFNKLSSSCSPKIN